MEGVEPPLTEPESAVLPLDDIPMVHPRSRCRFAQESILRHPIRLCKHFFEKVCRTPNGLGIDASGTARRLSRCAGRPRSGRVPLPRPQEHHPVREAAPAMAGIAVRPVPAPPGAQGGSAPTRRTQARGDRGRTTSRVATCATSAGSCETTTSPIPRSPAISSIARHTWACVSASSMALISSQMR